MVELSIYEASALPMLVTVIVIINTEGRGSIREQKWYCLGGQFNYHKELWGACHGPMVTWKSSPVPTPPVKVAPLPSRGVELGILFSAGSSVPEQPLWPGAVPWLLQAQVLTLLSLCL